MSRTDQGESSDTVSDVSGSVRGGSDRRSGIDKEGLPNSRMQRTRLRAPVMRNVPRLKSTDYAHYIAREGDKYL